MLKRLMASAAVLALSASAVFAGSIDTRKDYQAI